MRETNCSATEQKMELFGGAIRIASLPSRFKDLSDFRQVPDHQEVFSDPESDQTVIVEINEAVSDNEGIPE
jgi:hypothetical protein